MNYIKHMAIDFAKKNNLYGKGISFQKLLNVARQNGYIVLDYSQRAKLILFDLYDRAKDSSSVSIVDECGNAIIFLNKKLPVSKQLFGLAHEIGHIILKHPPGEQEKRKYENEANLFAHYLLDAEFDFRRIKRTIKILIGILCACLFAILIIFAFESSHPSGEPEAQNTSVNLGSSSTNISSEYKHPTTQTPAPSIPRITSALKPIEQTTTCYYTESGKVYHLYRDCYHIKNLKEVHTDTIADNPKPRCCSTCKSRRNQNEN